MPENYKKVKAYSTKEMIKDFWFLLSGYKLKFISYTGILIVASSMPFVITYYLGKIVDFLTNYTIGDSLNFFYLAIAIIGIAGALQVWLRFVCKWNVYQIGTEVRMKVRILAMAKLADLELSWHEKENTGSKIQKITIGSDSLYRLFSFVVDSIIPTFTGLLGAIVALSFFSFKYLAFSLVFAGVYLFGEFYFNKKLAYWQDQMNRVKEKVSGKIHEAASNILTVKTLGLKSSLNKSIEEYETEYKTTWLASRKANQSKFKTQKIFIAFLYAGFIFLTGSDVITGLITVGSMIIFIGYFSRLTGALEEITNKFGEVIEIRSGVGRLMLILDKRTIHKESSQYVNIPENWKLINFRNVGFKYKDRWVLKNFNLSIKKGDKIGIVGGSGEGKSTLLKLLMGLYEPNEGSITIGNIPIGKVKSSSLTKTVTAVLQDSEMFNLPLKNNICISSEQCNELLFNTAIRTAELTELIKKLPRGIDTLIGEKGYKVSGGERQRVGIARAVYRNSDVLIMDEATSHLDSKIEAVIQKNMKTFLSNKTVLIIAHRLSTLREVDSIILIERGKVAEQGSFDALINKKGRFYALWNQQRKMG